MKIMHYTDASPQAFDGDEVRGVVGRVAIGRADGAPHFCMRVFELAVDGHTPRHRHEWEHEIFFHSGSGEVYQDERWNPVTPGTTVYIPGNEEHQIRNKGSQPLVFVCLIPSGAPEL